MITVADTNGLTVGSPISGVGARSRSPAVRPRWNQAITVTNTTGLGVGKMITGVGIPNNTTITGITDATVFTISNTVNQPRTARL